MRVTINHKGLTVEEVPSILTKSLYPISFNFAEKTLQMNRYSLGTPSNQSNSKRAYFIYRPHSAFGSEPTTQRTSKSSPTSTTALNWRLSPIPTQVWPSTSTKSTTSNWPVSSCSKANGSSWLLSTMTTNGACILMAPYNLTWTNWTFTENVH